MLRVLISLLTGTTVATVVRPVRDNGDMVRTNDEDVGDREISFDTLILGDALGDTANDEENASAVVPGSANGRPGNASAVPPETPAPSSQGKPVAVRKALVVPGIANASNMLRYEKPYSDKLLYDHMPKTGGTYIAKVVRAAAGRNKFTLVREFDHYNHSLFDEHFTIGSVRNPCDYYLSLWSYGVDFGGRMRSHLPEESRWLYETEAQLKDSPADMLRFRRWVREISRPGYPGIMSLRMFISYAAQGRAVPRGWLPPASMTTEVLNWVRRSMRHFTRKHINCWVYSENLDEDLQNCLAKWEKQSGQAVDWSKYNFAKQAAYEKRSDHGKCQDYFDPDTVKLIWDLEGNLFEKFGYDKCCA